MRRFFNGEQPDTTVLTAAYSAETGIAPGNRMRKWMHAITEAELRMVRWLARLTRLPPIAALTIAVNLLGNGWLYPPIALGLLLFGASHAMEILTAALCSTAVAHALYALVKRGTARPRPFEKDAGLVPLARPLDRYSFPSGHCMTLVAVAIPIVRAIPQAWPFFAIAICVLAFCRLAAAHHYPSDVAGGICFGIAVSVPVSAWLLPG